MARPHPDHTARADLPEGGESPLAAALASRDRKTLDMVAEAIRHNSCRLASADRINRFAMTADAIFQSETAVVANRRNIEILESCVSLLGSTDLIDHPKHAFSSSYRVFYDVLAKILLKLFHRVTRLQTDNLKLARLFLIGSSEKVLQL